MKTQCTQCGTQVTSDWFYCPRCAARIPHELSASHQTPTSEHVHVDPEHTSAPGGFGGLLFGVLVAPVMVIVGTLLCLTGLGAILGIPMILGAILAPLAGPLMGLGAHKGKCPSCGMVVTSMTDDKMYDCPACNRTFPVTGAVTRQSVVKAG